VTKQVAEALIHTNDLRNLTTEVLQANPSILATIRMCTCPPLARDRLIGLAYANKNLVGKMEQGLVPARISQTLFRQHLMRITKTLARMLDVDIFPWLKAGRQATKVERYRASTIVADRLCNAVSDPIIRNAHEKRQIELVAHYLRARRYVQKAPIASAPITEMEPGTFSYRVNFSVADGKVKIPIDIVVQPRRPRPSRLPLLIEAKAAGDFTNVNKRRKEEAMKIHQLKQEYGRDIEFLLLLGGYFDSGYLGYEAAEGFDWIWEHRIEDLDILNL
jgi:hypothetical protein